MSAVVLGLGVTTPFGFGMAPTWAALLAGSSAMAPISRFDASRYPVRFAAQGPDILDGAGELVTDAPTLGRAWLEAAVDEALRGVDLSGVPRERIGVYVGSEAARPELALMLRSLDGLAPPRSVLEDHAPWSPTRWLAARLGALGPAATLSTACTSSGQAVGEALLAVRRGEVDVAVAAGVDVLVHPLMITGFSRLGALSERNGEPELASRPFDRDRDGFVLGEGAGVVVLAAPRIAGRLGPHRGTVRGYGCTSNAWRITDSPPDGRGAAEAMQLALIDAGATPAEVAWVHAHGTSTRQNDVSEARGIRSALGAQADQVPVSSTKSMFGHLVAACGVVGVALALQAVATRRAPQTRNLERPDPECDVRHVVGAPADLRPGVALVNAFGFGGVNATVAVGA